MIMKRLFICFSVLVFATILNTQYTSAQNATESNDSTANFLGKDVMKYKGQELYLNLLNEKKQKFGYNGFIVDYKKDDDLLNDENNIYKPNENYNSQYEYLGGKYFRVLDVIAHPKAKEDAKKYGDKYYLQLQIIPNGDIVYYKYDANEEFSFPFIATGFYAKQKELLKGKDFVVSDEVLKHLRNLNTGKSIDFTTGEEWKCIDLTIDIDEGVALVMQNNKAIRFLLPYSNMTNEQGIKKVFTADEAFQYTKKFNENNFRRILQNKIRVGMTKEMTKLAWGEPIEISESGSGKNKTEQWVYPAGNLTFRNDKIINTK